jgi:phosphatidylethanolamine-binding protein (PEBP) family uncharacterized protein
VESRRGRLRGFGDGDGDGRLWLEFGEILITSPAFANGHPIPARYTCAGADVSPPLQWSRLPTGAKELFVIALDVRNGGHNSVVWALGGIHPSVGQIAAGAIPAGAVVGIERAGKAAWGGVCGAKGERHHIAFLVYALRSKLHLKPGFNPLLIRRGLKSATISTGVTIASYRHA